MKKREFKNLSLKKISISHLENEQVIGGRISGRWCEVSALVSCFGPCDSPNATGFCTL